MVSNKRHDVYLKNYGTLISNQLKICYPYEARLGRFQSVSGPVESRNPFIHVRRITYIKYSTSSQ